MTKLVACLLALMVITSYPSYKSLRNLNVTFSSNIYTIYSAVLPVFIFLASTIILVCYSVVECVESLRMQRATVKAMKEVNKFLADQLSMSKL